MRGLDLIGPKANISLKLAPKHHELYEIAESAPRLGNPRFFSTYADESFNRVIGRLAKHAHPMRFAITLLFKYSVLRAVRGQHF